MKKVFHLFICFMLVLSACSKEETSVPESVSPNEVISFYGVKTIDQDSSPISAKGVVQNSKKWPQNAIISVRFLDGSVAFQNLVKQYAAEWEQYIGIKFNFVASGNADVRIQFDGPTKYITWSYTGTDCKNVVTNQSKPTVNFDSWGSKTNDKKRGDVLRVFGQILGLELEHRHTSFNPEWRGNSDLQKENRLKNHWSLDIEDINWVELTEYVFNPHCRYLPTLMKKFC